jgi:hypothetical protein
MGEGDDVKEEEEKELGGGDERSRRRDTVYEMEKESRTSQMADA